MLAVTMHCSLADSRFVCHAGKGGDGSALPLGGTCTRTPCYAGSIGTSCHGQITNAHTRAKQPGVHTPSLPPQPQPPAEPTSPAHPCQQRAQRLWRALDHRPVLLVRQGVILQPHLGCGVGGWGWRGWRGEEAGGEAGGEAWRRSRTILPPCQSKFTVPRTHTSTCTPHTAPIPPLPLSSAAAAAP